MVWTLCGSDARLAGSAVATLHAPEATERRYNERGGIELRPGIGELLRGLHRRGLLLGLAANQPLRVIEELDRHDLGSLFSHREVSAHHGFRKPDTRLFLRACLDLGVPPGECIMVGDRIDNDIFPARLLGMRTVLFRTGRHINQQPRSGDDVPDAVAWTVDDLAEAIDSLIEAEG
jgi:HAD superfamily hydrolase (TIGR01509 family)